MVKPELIGMKTAVFELLSRHLHRFCSADIYDQKLDEFLAVVLEHIIVRFGSINIEEEKIEANAFKYSFEKIKEAVLSNVGLAQKLASEHVKS